MKDDTIIDNKQELKDTTKNKSKLEGIVKKATSDNTVALSVKEISTFEQAEKLADYIAGSSIYNAPFKDKVDEDGITKEVVNKNAIVTCLLLGNELGFKPMESITLGRTLNREAMIKCKRGQDLGLSPIASLQNIYVFKTSQAEIVYTGIHVVNKVLTDAGVRREIIDDASSPYFEYFVASGFDEGKKVNIDNSNKDEYVVINTGISRTNLEQALKDGKIPVKRLTTKRALVKLTRGKESIAIPYTLQQAIDAGLYHGINSDKEEVKGKDNWNKHPETHLVKMSIMLGARIIASDKLNGLYVDSEINGNDTNVQDVDYEEV